MNMFRLAGIWAATMALMTVAAPTRADEFPIKPVRLVVGYAAGGGTDVIARIISPELSRRWNGQPVVIENRAGASGMVAADNVVRSPHDGYTLLLGYTPEVAINKLVYKQMSYDPIADLQPIALVASAPLFLVTGPKLANVSLKDLIGKDGPPLSFGSPGTGGQQHLAGELFRLRTGRATLHVPYRGAAPAVNDLLAGQLDMFFSTPPVILQHVRAGTLHALFVTSDKRDPAMPDVPSAKEVGLPNFEIANWFGLFAPRGMDPALVDKMAADVKAVLNDPAIKHKLLEQGLTATYMSPTELAAYRESEMKKYAAIIDESGLEKQ